MSILNTVLWILLGYIGLGVITYGFAVVYVIVKCFIAESPLDAFKAMMYMLFAWPIGIIYGMKILFPIKAGELQDLVVDTSEKLDVFTEKKEPN